ncbi:MAG TPA: glutathione S-transferase N-terminal domain-containing protein [Stellaceae bacterium]|nr:glutathione S-transferase N-terminal domain-containing protein [Stellaceae bacterium]
MAAPIIYGPAFSTYVRTVRLALEEKPASYELVDVAMMKGAHKEPEYLARNPFAKVPAFSHDGFDLYETDAIVRYIDQTIAGQDLQPLEAKPRARMNQIIGIMDSFAYTCMITKVVLNRLVAPMVGGTPDEATIKEALPSAELCLKEFERLMGNEKFLAGDKLSLADLFVIPVYHYLALTPEGEALLRPRGKIRAWWDSVKSRSSVVATEPKFG